MIHPNHPDPDLTTAKAQARAHAVAVRRQAHSDYGRLAAEKLAIYGNALTFDIGTVVAGYWPMGDELDPRPLLELLGGRGCTLALPVVTARGQALTFRRWDSGDPLEAGFHGTLHPIAASAVLVPKVLLVPLLAFDAHGYRLGYGGGYYDRTLADLRLHAHVTAIGIAFAAQQVQAVPRDRHDQPLDLMLTEHGPMKPEIS
ncbi:5-formyltetrahydrofolate cyclo-ligase [Magnetospirillum sulfuroxidans]|uniref:5-formyltetrahydrofolate cyclo-ligase n=1 Tax=Magnetospirillum sulfuroxidans TaxID=611300 RepID=A0ABS5I7J7_9PROT|nr:5-formyltetrahydrofolate cyclo-ligase [Magnetospirillum sulfuroxidans]MBR9970385.1 5-formyltetrahydrofolate cyclo-ligase [Magnetospirillum sulfuroxidans]